MRIDLRLPDESEWLKVFDPRDSTLIAAVSKPPPVGSQVRVDLVIGKEGARVILHGQVITHRDDGPGGCTVAISPADREKINYVNGFVRGGLLNLRERRRLPVRLEVTYGGLEGPCKTFTRDINEEGVFILTDAPLPEESEVHLFVAVPGAAQPLSLTGIVQHTVVPDDEDIPGMGILFKLDEAQRAAVVKAVDELERAFMSGSLPEALLL
ncbi:MAG TPA: PilZ domain-containing protein [Kofleriaceae bacterium]|nr:PilZ domain-containing protein [Kofleriaceae bacterium]